MSGFPKELSDDAEKKWRAFSDATRAAKITIAEDENFYKTLRRVFAYSDFVAQSCIRRPEILSELLKSNDLKRSYTGNTIHKKIERLLVDIENEEMLGRALRQVRRYEMVRIAWRDLAGWADLNETLSDLSGLADACIEEALSFLHHQQCREYGTPTGPDGTPQLLVVIGMGKLGGRELNFSSDVDLIFVYPESGQTVGGTQTMTHAEYFSRLARHLLRIVGDSTAEGILFRTDLRLRPYGESGPVVMNFDAMEAYYQRQGREWERYAWIKARVVAGDKTAGDQLMARLKPFVYRRYLDFGAFESMRLMKEQIMFEEQRNGIENNIKLGPGGIREIEFFGQVFQLIRGGVQPGLQRRRILKVLAVLADENYISDRVKNDLEKAYRFLRNTENRLQEFSDQQIHALPPDPLGRARLAAAMNFEGWDAFTSVLFKHMQRVHFHFNKLLVSTDSDQLKTKGEKELEGVWRGSIEENRADAVLAAAGYENHNEVLDLLGSLRSDSATRALSNKGRELLDKLLPMVLREVGKSGHPLVNLKHIINLIKTIERRTCYLALLTENPNALVHLVKLADSSPWVVSFVARHPVLLDELLDPRTLYAPPEKKEIAQELQKRLERIDSQNLEHQMEALCIFKQINMLRVAAADVTDALSLVRVSDHLSDIAETVLTAVVDLSWTHLTEKHGLPACSLDKTVCERGFAVIAYGKLGGIELGYDSDLDLVFLHAGTPEKTAGGKSTIESAQFFARLGQRVVHILTTHTPAGFLYETDMRLRPSGSAGLLVCQVDAFREYQTEKAWTWEHQALVRARVVSGDIGLGNYFNQIRKEVLARPRVKSELQEEVGRMRARLRKENLSPGGQFFDLKQSPGGIVDIEFLVQYLVLLKSYEFAELVAWTDNVRLLDTLKKTGVLDAPTADFLQSAYLTCRSAAHRLSLQNKPAMIFENKFDDMRKKTIEIWHRFIPNSGLP